MSRDPLLLVDIHHAAYYGWSVWTDIDAPERWTAETAERLMRHPGYCMGINLGGHCYEESPTLAGRIRAWLQMFPGRVDVTAGDYAQLTACVRGDEANLRQLTVGLETIQRVLGVRPRIWTMSEPGNFAQLPQVLADLGYTGALLRIHGPGQGGSATTTSEHGVVWWEGPDGTRIAAIPEYEGDRLRKENDCPEGMWMMTRYLNERASRGNYTLDDLWAWKESMEARGISPVVLSKDDDQNSQPSNNNLCMESGHALAADTEGDDRFRWITAHDLFEEIPEPSHVYRPGAELFETRKKSFCDYGHDGNKDWVVDLLADNALRDAEFATVLAAGLGYDGDSAEDVLDAAWREHLGAQNHDLSLKGSANLMYHLQFQATRAAHETFDETLGPVFADIDTGDHGAVIVTNPHGWERAEYATVTLPADATEEMSLHDGEDAVPWEVVRTEAELVTMGFVARAPALGYRAYRLVPETRSSQTGVEISGLIVKSDAFTVTFGETGGIVSLIPAGDDRSVVRRGGEAAAGIAIAGDVGGETCRSGGELNIRRDGVSVVAEERGMLGATHEYAITYRIAPDAPYIMLDIAIVPNYTDPDKPGAVGDPDRKVELELRLADHVRPERCVRRQPLLVDEYDPANDPTFAAVNWCDYGAEGPGIAVLNRGSIGQRWDRDAGVANTILWNGGNRGLEWQLALMSHAGGWRSARVHEAGTGYAAPLRCVFEPGHAGPLPGAHSVAAVTPDNVTVSSAFRRDGRSYVRVWEHGGEVADASFTSGGSALAVERVSLELDAGKGGTLIGAREIATYRLP